MVKEIERKFLMDLNYWSTDVYGVPYRQGYLAVTEKGIVRIRTKGEVATLTIKSSGIGISRDEFEYQIPMDEAKLLLTLCENDIIEKTRYKVKAEGKQWDVDKFHGKNEGLWIAEVELESEGESVTLPKWATEEVTGDERFYNVYLSKHPYTDWIK